MYGKEIKEYMRKSNTPDLRGPEYLAGRRDLAHAGQILTCPNYGDYSPPWCMEKKLK